MTVAVVATVAVAVVLAAGCTNDDASGPAATASSTTFNTAAGTAVPHAVDRTTAAAAAEPTVDQPGAAAASAADTSVPATVAVSGGELPAQIVDGYATNGGDLVTDEEWTGRFGPSGLPRLSGPGVTLAEAVRRVEQRDGGWVRTDEASWLAMSSDDRDTVLRAVAEAAGVRGTPTRTGSTEQAADCVIDAYPAVDGVEWTVQGCAYERFSQMIAVGVSRTAATDTAPGCVGPDGHLDRRRTRRHRHVQRGPLRVTRPGRVHLAPVDTGHHRRRRRRRQCRRDGRTAGWVADVPRRRVAAAVGSDRRHLDPVGSGGRVRLGGPLVNGDRTAQRPPVNEFFPLLLIGFLVVVAWSAPTVASLLWSSTDWRAGRDIKTLFDAYTNLFHPERIPGAGMDGMWFGVTTVAIAFGFVVIVSLVGRPIPPPPPPRRARPRPRQGPRPVLTPLHRRWLTADPRATRPRPEARRAARRPRRADRPGSVAPEGVNHPRPRPAPVRQDVRDRRPGSRRPLRTRRRHRSAPRHHAVDPSVAGRDGRPDVAV